MHLRGFLIAWICAFIGVSVTPRHVSAEPTYCSDLYTAICGPSGNRAEAREARINQTIHEIEASLTPEIIALSKEFDLPSPDKDDLLNSALKSIAFRYTYELGPAKAAASAIFKKVEEALLSRANLADFAQLQQQMIRVIRQRRGLNSDLRDEIERRIKQTFFVFPSEYIRAYIGTRDELWPILTRVSYDGAWNLAPERFERDDQRLVILFPGLLAAETGGADFVLGHELSHSFDFDTLPAVYGEMTSCMSRSYGVQFKEWTEISADYWGIELISQKLSDAGASPEQALEFLRSSHEILCEAQSEDPVLGPVQSRYFHPSGQFRIQEILGKNSSIRALLGCSPQASKPSC